MTDKKLAKEENMNLVADLLSDLLLKPKPPTVSDFKKVEKIAKKCSTCEWLQILWKVCRELPWDTSRKGRPLQNYARLE